MFGRIPECFHQMQTGEHCTTLHKIVASHSPMAIQRMRRQATAYTAPDDSVRHPPTRRAHSLSHRPKGPRYHPLLSPTSETPICEFHSRVAPLCNCAVLRGRIYKECYTKPAAISFIWLKSCNIDGKVH